MNFCNCTLPPECCFTCSNNTSNLRTPNVTLTTTATAGYWHIVDLPLQDFPVVKNPTIEDLNKEIKRIEKQKDIVLLEETITDLQKKLSKLKGELNGKA